MSEENKTVDTPENKVSGNDTPKDVINFEEISKEELFEKLQKAQDKADNQEKLNKILKEKSKEVKTEAQPVSEEPKTEPEVATKQDLEDLKALQLAGVNHSSDIETINKYKGDMTIAVALQDANIRNILAVNQADRKAKEQAEGLQGISGGQTKMTDKQFMASIEADPTKLASLSSTDRVRYGRLLAQG